MYTDYYNDKDDYYGEKERFSVSNKDLSIFPLYVLVMDASTKIKSAAKKSNLSSRYESSLNSKNPAKELINFVNDEDELNGSLDSDLNQLKSLVSYNSNDWFVTFGGASGNESDADQLAKEISSSKSNESAKLRRLMRENRRLRRSLRSRVNESGENITAKKLGSIDSYNLTIYQIDGIKDPSSYSDTPTYPGLSHGDHDEYKLRDTDKMVKWLKTISDDLKDDGNSDEAKNVDKLTDKVANGGSHLYAALSNRYGELTLNQVVDFITREVELRDPKDESASISNFMRENRKLRHQARSIHSHHLR